MTAETSNARGEWVLVPRVPSAGMLDSAENAMIESECAYNAGKQDARSDAHGFPTMRIWQAVVAYRAMLAAAPQPQSAPVWVDYAKRLATSLWQRHYREDAPQWEPFDDLPGLLSQIDNMVSGLTRAPALAQQPAAVDEAYPTPRNRAEAVALARLALAHLGVIDAHIDAAIARCETDLATQPQGDK